MASDNVILSTYIKCFCKKIFINKARSIMW